MPSLKIHGPKRRESVRISSRPQPRTYDESIVAIDEEIYPSEIHHPRLKAGPKSPRDVSTSSMEDTINLQGGLSHGNKHQSSLLRRSPVGGVAKRKLDSKESSGRESANTAPTNKSRANEADIELTDVDDHVEEYDFSNEPDIDPAEYELSDDGLAESESTVSVISISDDDEQRSAARRDPAEETYDLESRPWRDFTLHARFEWEAMYTFHPERLLHDSWDSTEVYIRERDEEMVRYLEDFPLDKWLIPMPKAKQAYHDMVTRQKWRKLGIRIFNRNKMPGTDIANDASAYQRTPYQQPEAVLVSLGQSSSSSQSQTLQTVQRAASGPQEMPVHQQAMHKHAHSYANGGRSGHLLIAPQGSQTTIQTAGGVSAATAAFRPSMPLGPPPNITPPYPLRQRLFGRKATNSKAGRHTKKKGAEADFFPWWRQMDFEREKVIAAWDDSIYDPHTLARMEQTRKTNEPILARLESNIQDQQRSSRLSKGTKRDDLNTVSGSDDLPTADTEDPPRETSVRAKVKETINIGGDHAGNFVFLNADDLNKARALGKRNPLELIDAGLDETIPLDLLKDINVSWNPNKKGVSEELEHCIFSIKDSVVTRQQLELRPILTRRAAERICDFCPDLVWRDMLLRMVSEAGYGNKDLRDRFCLNGWYCDKATMTKRISAALGQKQASKFSKDSVKAEDEWYHQSVHEFADYVEYFGKRSNHRTPASKLASVTKAALNRKIQLDAQAVSASKALEETDSEIEVLNVRTRGMSKESKDKRPKNRYDPRPDSSMIGTSSGGEGEETSDGAVSLQNSDYLDMMSD